MIPPLIAIYSWPLITSAIFARLRVAHALIITIVAGYLLLPTQAVVRIPILPNIDKNSIAALSALALCTVFWNSARSGAIRPEWAERVRPGVLPQSIVGITLLALLLAGVFLTTLTNGDRLVYGPRVIPALRPYDSFSAVLGMLISLIPFLLARKFLAHPDEHRLLLRILFVAALIYSLPALWEVRMSPQLNRIVYGFFPHDWSQHVRGGGFRPIVFLSHGLGLGAFLSYGLLAGLACFRLEKRERRVAIVCAVFWLFGTLFLAKTLAALILALLIGPLILLLSVRLQLIVAASLVVLVLTYPMLRFANYVPTERLVSIAESIDPQRAASLAFRFRHEDHLLDKASERPFFGWGSWGRNRVYDDRGNDISVTDGYWVILFGSGGIVRYVAIFGLLGISIVTLALRRKAWDVSAATSMLCLILTANLIQLLPNAGLNQITWLMAGALAGRLEFKRITESEATRVMSPRNRQLRYARTFSDTATRREGTVYRAERTSPKSTVTRGRNIFSRQKFNA